MARSSRFAVPSGSLYQWPWSVSWKNELLTYHVLSISTAMSTLSIALVSLTSCMPQIAPGIISGRLFSSVKATCKRTSQLLYTTFENRSFRRVFPRESCHDKEREQAWYTHLSGLLSHSSLRGPQSSDCELIPHKSFSILTASSESCHCARDYSLMSEVCVSQW